jgi:hypothetical protein
MSCYSASAFSLTSARSTVRKNAVSYRCVKSVIGVLRDDILGSSNIFDSSRPQALFTNVTFHSS